jgi:hypothetical protein
MKRAAVILLALAGQLSASTWRGDTLIAQAAAAPWRFGLFRIQPQLILSDFGYDSNIYHQPDAVDDYSFTAGPQIGAFLSLKRKVIFTLTESPRYVYYYKTARERTWNNFLNASVSFLLNNFFIQAGAHLNDAKQRWNYEIDVRPRLKDTGYDALLLWQPSRKTSIAAGVKQNRFRYDDSSIETLGLAERLNRDETAVNLTFYNQLTARTRAFVDFEYVRADFERGVNSRDALSYAGYGGFEFSARGRIRGRLRLGYKLFRPLTAGQPDFKGLVGDSSLAVTLLRPLVLRASYLRDVRFSYLPATPYYVEGTAGGGLSLYLFRRRIRLDYDYSQLQYDYPDVVALPAAEDPEALPPAAVPSRQDRVGMHTVGVFYRIGENIGLGLRAGRWNRRVNIYSWKANRDFVGLNLTYEF